MVHSKSENTSPRTSTDTPTFMKPVSNTNCGKNKKMRKPSPRQEKISRKKLDYHIYMAQFTAPEKTMEYYLESTQKPQFRMSIYPDGFNKPVTQREEMMLPSNFCKLSFCEMIAKQADGSLKKSGK